MFLNILSNFFLFFSISKVPKRSLFGCVGEVRCLTTSLKATPLWYWGSALAQLNVRVASRREVIAFVMLGSAIA
ncbi:MAG: hypothetical protein RMY34_22590 [Aulosira sp. DedQUE10]|nr:hypothetical protein [Aulosira sp. DedQUE10]